MSLSIKSSGKKKKKKNIPKFTCAAKVSAKMVLNSKKLFVKQKKMDLNFLTRMTFSLRNTCKFSSCTKINQDFKVYSHFRYI